MPEIPRIFHQTWKVARLPRRFRRFHHSWLKFHPDAEHRLWTDRDNRALIEEHYPWFLPVYDAYPKPIMRVDAARYFILKHYGGIYVDLDFECLRSIYPLLRRRQLVVGCEPPQHHENKYLRQQLRQFDKLVCNAFIASAAGHPFWDHVTDMLVKCAQYTDVLECTGPIFFTRACNTYSGNDIYVESHKTLYPVPRKEFRDKQQSRLCDKAYAVHYWEGTWWRRERWRREITFRAKRLLLTVAHFPLLLIKRCARRGFLLLSPGESLRALLYYNFSIPTRHGIDGRADSDEQVWATRVVCGRRTACALVDLAACRALLEQQAYPKVSCLMVTRERFTLACRAIECFRRQSYPNKELVIVCDDADERLQHWVKSRNDASLVFLQLDARKTLGELRNFSVRKASGDYVAQWDDDDIVHPGRLMLQMSAMSAMNAEVSFLHRQLIWMPQEEKLGISAHRMIENTMICNKSRMLPYDSKSKGEDTPVCEEIAQSSVVVLCDYPDAYVYVAHGSNTWGDEHFKNYWEQSLHRYRGDSYSVKLQELERCYGMESFDLSGKAAPDGAGPAKLYAGVTDASVCPSILVLTPVKNAAAHIPQYLENLAASQYPREKISLALLESDSEDDTYRMLEEKLPPLREKYARVEFYKQDFGYRTKRARWEASEQLTRRSILAKSRNRLLFQALRDEEWVLWIDVDLLSWPADAFLRLLDAGKDIVVPNCVKENGDAFDLNTFKLSENAAGLDWRRYVMDGILQPPVGYGRRYLDSFEDEAQVELDGVGGTMLLVRADLHREGLIFPTCPYRYYIETEGLSRLAKDMGYRCWGIPALNVVHKDC